MRLVHGNLSDDEYAEAKRRAREEQRPISRGWLYEEFVFNKLTNSRGGRAKFEPDRSLNGRLSDVTKAITSVDYVLALDGAVVDDRVARVAADVISAVALWRVWVHRHGPGIGATFDRRVRDAASRALDSLEVHPDQLSLLGVD